MIYSPSTLRGVQWPENFSLQHPPFFCGEEVCFTLVALFTHAAPDGVFRVKGCKQPENKCEDFIVYLAHDDRLGHFNNGVMHSLLEPAK